MFLGITPRVVASVDAVGFEPLGNCGHVWSTLDNRTPGRAAAGAFFSVRARYCQPGGVWLYLHRCCPSQARGFRVVFEAMQRLVGNDLVQVKGAEMLQTLINEEPQVGARIHQNRQPRSSVEHSRV